MSILPKKGFECTVGVYDKGLRLDKFIQQKSNLNYSLIQKLIKKNQFAIKKVDASINRNLMNSRILDEMDVVFSFCKFEDLKTECKKEMEPSDFIKKLVIFDSKDFFAIHKPAGLASHWGKGHEENHLERHLYSFAPEAKLLHRIDAQASGLLLVAKQRLAAQRLLSMELEKTVSPG
jgi:23S rRNA pseudouridine955/2504/2580 synthase